MKTITNIICSAFATVALAASSFGAIYETPKQFEPRKPDDVRRVDGSTVFLTWAGKTVVHVGGFYNGRCFMESFWYRDNHRMTNGDINKFLNPYLAAGLSTGPITGDSRNDFLSLRDHNGKAPAMMHYALERNVLSVMTWETWQAVYPKEAATRAALLKQKASATAAPTGKKTDCLIIATEAFARLKQTAVWARIGGFRFLNDGKDEGGHAVVFYQPTSSSNVFMYDETLGSLDLGAKSHDLTVIIDSLNRMMKKADLFQAGDPHWVSEAGGLVSDQAIDQGAATTSASQDAAAGSDTADEGLKPAKAFTPALRTVSGTTTTPAPVATSTLAEVTTAPTTNPSIEASKPTEQRLAVQFGYALVGIVVFSLYVLSVVICFQKGKPVFASLGILALLFGGMSLWAIIGACRLAKPDSWWARKKYGPKTMDIAHRRFTPFYNQAQEAVPITIDDPVERALERVGRKQAII